MKLNEVIRTVRDIQNDRIALIEQEVWEEHHREGWTLEEMQEEIDSRVYCEADEESILLEVMISKIRELCEYFEETDRLLHMPDSRTKEEWAARLLFSK